ncbi:Uncharacterized protein PBTT_00364 [Plasmodiophora brassicae]
MGCRIVAGQYWRERQPRLGGTLHDNRSMFWRWISLRCGSSAAGCLYATGLTGKDSDEGYVTKYLNGSDE